MKKIAQILFICIIVAAIIIIATMGFKVGLKYSENTQININIGKEFDVADVKNIAKEIFPGQQIIVQQVELYKDMAQITVKDASDEQIENLNTKINEKYEIENKTSDVIISKNANTRLKEIAKPYVAPMLWSFLLILIYVLIRFRKLGIVNVLNKTVMMLVAPQELLIAVYAIARIPVNKVAAVISIVLYLLTVFILVAKLLKEKRKEVE